nr:hypothetical protein Hi04_10k_c4246_00013 [uncultured bacterium]
MRQLRELARISALSMRFPTDVCVAPLTRLAGSSMAPDRDIADDWAEALARAFSLRANSSRWSRRGVAVVPTTLGVARHNRQTDKWAGGAEIRGNWSCRIPPISRRRPFVRAAEPGFGTTATPWFDPGPGSGRTTSLAEVECDKSGETGGRTRTLRRSTRSYRPSATRSASQLTSHRIPNGSRTTP